MATLREARAHQEEFLERAKTRTEPVSSSIEGVDVKVNPGVFPPATDTRLLAEYVKVDKGERIIDVTTGCGVIAIIAGLQGASGYAVDINPVAVDNAQENIDRYGVEIEAIASDLFENIPDGEQFEWIFANGPFFEGKITDPMDYACYGARPFVENLMAGAKVRLKPQGKLRMVVSEYSELDHLAATAEANRLSATILETKKSSDGERGYLLYEFKL